MSNPLLIHDLADAIVRQRLQEAAQQALLPRRGDAHGTPAYHFPARRSQPRRHALGLRQPRRLPPHSSLAKEVAVSVSVLYMAMSLDGYIAGPNDEPDNPGGDGFMRLHEWFLGPA